MQTVGVMARGWQAFQTNSSAKVARRSRGPWRDHHHLARRRGGSFGSVGKWNTAVVPNIMGGFRRIETLVMLKRQRTSYAPGRLRGDTRRHRKVDANQVLKPSAVVSTKVEARRHDSRLAGAS